MFSDTVSGAHRMIFHQSILFIHWNKVKHDAFSNDIQSHNTDIANRFFASCFVLLLPVKNTPSVWPTFDDLGNWTKLYMTYK